jgi:hypothetical protein
MRATGRPVAGGALRVHPAVGTDFGSSLNHVR